MSFSSAPDRWSLSTRRRRSWSGISRTRGASGSRRGTPRNPWSTTFPRMPQARRFPMASMTWAATKHGSVLDVTMTPLHSRSPRFGGGGRRWAAAVTLRLASCSSLPMRGAATATACARGKQGLQQFADDTGVRVHVSHFPPGTSKWNKIEHRLFCHITHNWRGKPLRTFETIVDLIGNTRTDAGLRVRAELDTGGVPERSDGDEGGNGSAVSTSQRVPR